MESSQASVREPSNGVPSKERSALPVSRGKSGSHVTGKRRVLFGNQPVANKDTDKGNTAPGSEEPVVDEDVEIFADNGRLAVELDILVAIVASKTFTPRSFIERYMGQLSGSGFEAARQELDKVMGYVSNQILENAVANNEIYVLLCDSIQGMEGQIQRLHSVLASLRALSGELRFLSTADAGGGGESTSQVAGGAVTQSTTETSRLHRSAPSTAENELEPPELAPVLTVWRTFTEHLNLAMAERKLHKHHRLLAAAGAVLDNLLQQCVRKGDVNSTLPLQLWIEQKEVYLEESRRTAIALLENTILEPGIARTDLQQNVRLLSKLSTPLHAVTCLLASHEQTMEHQLQLLRTNVAADSNDFELLGAISQRVFGCIGRAANDLTLVFRKSAHELSSAYTVWALRLTERCVSVLVADVLLPFAVPMGLSATMECVLQIMVYCSCLEDTHRVCLQPHLLRVLWPQIDNVINSHISSANERIRSAAMRDVVDTVSTRRCAFPPSKLPQSGTVLISEIGFLVQEVLCMDAIEIGRSMRNATISMFRSFCDGVERGIQQAAHQNKGVVPQVLVAHGENIMMCLSFVMETALPKATASSAQKLGVLCVSRKMEPALHTIADALGVEAVQEDG